MAVDKFHEWATSISAYLKTIILGKYAFCMRSGSIASRRLVMKVNICYCLKSPDDGRKASKHVAWEYVDKLNRFVDNLILSKHVAWKYVDKLNRFSDNLIL
jgi:hypothetical protein